MCASTPQATFPGGEVTKRLTWDGVGLTDRQGTAGAHARHVGANKDGAGGELLINAGETVMRR